MPSSMPGRPTSRRSHCVVKPGLYGMPKVSATARLVTSPSIDVDRPADRAAGVGGGLPARVGNLQRPGKRDVAQGEGAGAAHRPGHVRHAVVDHVVDDEGRIAVRGGPAGGHAAPLVDGHVDDHAAGLHQPQVFAARPAAGPWRRASAPRRSPGRPGASCSRIVCRSLNRAR